MGIFSFYSENIVRLRWAEHLIRKSNCEMPERIMNYNPEGKRKSSKAQSTID
jgi:hypothetical protein